MHGVKICTRITIPMVRNFRMNKDAYKILKLKFLKSWFKRICSSQVCGLAEGFTIWGYKQCKKCYWPTFSQYTICNIEKSHEALFYLCQSIENFLTFYRLKFFLKRDNLGAKHECQGYKMSSCKIWKVPSCKAVIIVLWKAFTMGHKNSSFTDGKQHKQQLPWETRLLEHSSYHENKHFCALSYTSFIASFSVVGMVTQPF